MHLRDGREAVATAARGVGRLLSSIAEGIRSEWSPDDAQEWLERARRLDALVSDARRASERGRESLRFNPRATAFAALGDEVTGDDEVQRLRSAVSDGGDSWRDLRGLVQNAEVQRSDSFPAYGSLLVDAERPLDELERAEQFLAASTPDPRGRRALRISAERLIEGEHADPIGPVDQLGVPVHQIIAAGHTGAIPPTP